MPRRDDAHPYIVVWLGNVAPLTGMRGTLSAHSRVDLAVTAARKQRSALQSLWCGQAPWFVYQIIDARDGRVHRFIGR